jgi:hypothetical protein
VYVLATRPAVENASVQPPLELVSAPSSTSPPAPSWRPLVPLVSRKKSTRATPSASVTPLAVSVTLPPIVTGSGVSESEVMTGAAVAPTCTILATDGTPWSLRTNSMYEPGGAVVAPAGPLTTRPPVVFVNASRAKRWSMSMPCVTDPRRTSVTSAMLEASGVATANAPPYAIFDGADVTVGRVPLNRYGGEKISASGWFVSPLAVSAGCPPPIDITRPSGRSTAVEW